MSIRSERETKEQEIIEKLLPIMWKATKEYLLQFKDLTTEQSIETGKKPISDLWINNSAVRKTKTFIPTAIKAHSYLMARVIDRLKFRKLVEKEPHLLDEFNERSSLFHDRTISFNDITDDMSDDNFYEIYDNSGDVKDHIRREEKIPLNTIMINELTKNGFQAKPDGTGAWGIVILGLGYGSSPTEELLKYVKANKIEIYRVRNKLKKAEMAKMLLKIYATGNERTKSAIDNWIEKVILD